MSRLLYLVASRIDCLRGPAAIADLVSHDLGRSLGAEQVRYLITAKLLPLGIVAGQDGPAAAPKASPLLTLRARGTLVPECIANAVGVFLRPLFWWPIAAVVVVSVAALDYWLFAEHGLTAGLQQLLRDPADLPIVAGLTVASALFHEGGHAAGCRYGGARPRSCSSSSPSRTWKCCSSCSRSSGSTATSSSVTSSVCRICSPASARS